MTEHRWSKFWWQDYEGDDALRVVSLAAQGLWMRMLCAMHKGTPYGHLTVNGRAPTARQIAMMASATEREVAKLLTELEEAGVFSRTEEGIIYSRRMVRDKAVSDKAREDGKRGGNPSLRNPNRGGLTPPDNGGGYTLEAEAEAEAEADTPLAGGSARARGGRVGAPLPEGWRPRDPMLPSRRGHDPAAVLEKFRAHFRQATGAKALSADWDASWELWCAREAERPKPPLHTLPQAEQDRRILTAAGALGFEDPPPAPVVPLRIAQ